MTGKKHSQETIDKIKQKRSTPKEIQDLIIKEYLSGKTIKEIVKSLNVGHSEETKQKNE